MEGCSFRESWLSVIYYFTLTRPVFRSSWRILGPHIRGKNWRLRLDAQLTPLLPLAMFNLEAK